MNRAGRTTRYVKPDVRVIVARDGSRPAGRAIKGYARRGQYARLVLCSNYRTDARGLAAMHAAVRNAYLVDVAAGRPELRERVYRYLYARGMNVTRDIRGYSPKVAT